MSRNALLRSFLTQSGWTGPDPALLAGDASNRRYLRGIGPKGQPVVIMDAPPEKGEDVRPFIDITGRLRRMGFSAPEILAADTDAGFLILEDLGDDLYARAVKSGAPETVLYSTAVDLLAALHRAPEAATGLPPYDTATCLREAQLVTEWYLPGADISVCPDTQAEYDQLITTLCSDLLPDQPVCVLRDYHAENLLWLPERDALARVGLLDYQDALAGHPAYDLVSLLEDARRDTTPALQAEMLAHYIATSGAEDTSFRRAYAILGAQRNLKILGIFARLAKRDRKPIYIDHMPRVWGHLQGNLQHPALAGLKDWVTHHMPPPDTDLRAKLAGQT